jgi:hypothetical protein
VDPRAGLDDLEKRKFLILPAPNSDPLVVHRVASTYTDYAIPVRYKRNGYMFIVQTYYYSNYSSQYNVPDTYCGVFRQCGNC